jgi:polar amino acid transport system substrate-binding protein
MNNNNHKSKSNTLLRLLMSGFICIIFAGKLFADESITLIQGWETYAPFSFLDSQKNLTGLDIEFVNEIAKGTGLTIQYSQAPWARLLRWVEEGKIHVVSSVTKTPERVLFGYFSDAYFKESFIVYVRKGEKGKYPYFSLKDFIGSGLRIGVIRDNIYGAEYDRLTKIAEFRSLLEPVTSDAQNHQKLLLGRLDGFIQESSRMAIADASEIVAKVEPLFVIEEDFLHFMFSRKSTPPDVVQRFNSEILRMQTDGRYQKLFRKYKMDHYNMIQK